MQPTILSPVKSQISPDRRYIRVYGWLRIEASKAGYESAIANLLMGISLPNPLWWGQTLHSLEDWLRWPDRLAEQFSEKCRTDATTRETITDTALAADVLFQVSAMLAQESDLLTAATILGLTDGKKYRRQEILDKVNELSALVSKNLNWLDGTLRPNRPAAEETKPPKEDETLLHA